jgi:hypothetical protein
VDEATLLWGLLYGSIGLGYFIYGKKQKKKIPLACGIALMVFPYAVTDVWALAVTGVVLMTIPIVIRQ